jgi:hypothetical protein
MSLPPNPFPGPVPLRETDQLFSRKRETAVLIGRIVADRLVPLYSPSGAGKSSLLNAGVLPAMRNRGFRTHDPIRVGLAAPKDVNRYVWSCAESMGVRYEPAPLEGGKIEWKRSLFTHGAIRCLTFGRVYLTACEDHALEAWLYSTPEKEPRYDRIRFSPIAMTVSPDGRSRHGWTKPTVSE